MNAKNVSEIKQNSKAKKFCVITTVKLIVEMKCMVAV